MKTKIYHILFLLTIPFSFTLTSCKNNCADEQVVTENSFTDIRSSSIMPWTGIEVLKFIKNNTDTIIFINQGNVTSFNEVERPGGSCPVKYRLLNQTNTFKDSKSSFQFLIHYYLDSETNMFSDYFLFQINNNSTLGVYTPDIFSQTRIQMTIQGQTFAIVKGFGNNTGDSIYYNAQTPTQPLKKFLRIKFQNDIYEVLP